jgi:hypothetical protein
MNRLSKQLEMVLDNICFHGCKYVRECILKMQINETVQETKSINTIETQIVLKELISIMEVYDMQKN